MDMLHRNISSFFEELLVDLSCHPDTKAYITSIFIKYKSADLDFSQYSAGELFVKARAKQDFLTYQNLADWLFICSVIFPQHLKNASKDYYDNIARISYYTCYNLINKQWPCYEEMADNLIVLEDEVKKRIYQLKT